MDENVIASYLLKLFDPFTTQGFRISSRRH